MNRNTLSAKPSRYRVRQKLAESVICFDNITPKPVTGYGNTFNLPSTTIKQSAAEQSERRRHRMSNDLLSALTAYSELQLQWIFEDQPNHFALLLGGVSSLVTVIFLFVCDTVNSRRNEWIVAEDSRTKYYEKCSNAPGIVLYKAACPEATGRNA